MIRSPHCSEVQNIISTCQKVLNDLPKSNCGGLIPETLAPKLTTLPTRKEKCSGSLMVLFTLAGRQELITEGIK